MAIINTFDAYYNAVLTNENLIKLIEPLCAGKFCVYGT